MSKIPSRFKLATWIGVEKMNSLDIRSQSVPASHYSDDGATNMKAVCLLTEETGLNAPFKRCGSNAASGAVRLGSS